MRHTQLLTRSALVPTALLLAALALTGCSAANTASSTDQKGGIAAPQVAPNGVAADGATTSESGKVATDTTTADRQVVETGYATIVVDKPLDAATEATRITESVGGRVDARNEYAPVNGDSGSATLTLRIPAAALTATLDKLKALGTVQEVSLSSSDVTMQSQDLDARIKAMQASVDRLLTLLSSATDTDTLITLETAISDRQAQLESMESEKRYLADQVAMSTLTLNLVSPAQAEVTVPSTFWSGLQAGWAAFIAFFSGLLVALGVLLPWLVFAAIVTFAIIAIVRGSRRRRAVPAEAPESEPAPIDETASPKK